MTETVELGNLVAGDVLLYKGTGFISRAIQFFDGTDFSHAALYLGDETVGEAIATGLKRRSYQEGAAGLWVQAHRLKAVVPTMDPVLQTANAYLDQGNRYGYEQLLLLAFLCLTRKLRFTPSLRPLIRRVLDAAAAAISRMMSENQEPTICSEFVFRAYDEALPELDDIYALQINQLQSRIAAPRTVVGMREMPPTAPVKGQGVHPQSLLALLESSSGQVWLEAPPLDLTRATRAQPEPDIGSIEGLIENYLQEVKVDPQALPRVAAVEETSIGDLREATNNFAASLYAATHREEAVREMSLPAATAVIQTYLFRVAADFVTPADLYTTPSLYLLGRVERP